MQPTLNEVLPDLDSGLLKPNQGVPLKSLRGCFLAYIPGKFFYMRNMHKGDVLEEARGIKFECPKCGPLHTVVLPFGFKDVPAQLKPHIRVIPVKWPVQMRELTLHGGMKFKCGVSGCITEGSFYFRVG